MTGPVAVMVKINPQFGETNFEQLLELFHFTREVLKRQLLVYHNYHV